VRTLSLVGWGLAILLGAGTCSHAGRPCPPQRPFARRAPTLAPTDAATVAAVAATGGRYEVCGRESTYLIARDGERELTEPELKRVMNGLYHGPPGMESAGIGGVRCRSPSSRPSLGITLQVREQSAAPVQIARQLATLAPDGSTARVEVTIISAPGPRCAADDPACEPLPYQAACVEKTAYNPKATRSIVRAGGGSNLSCAHDGECVIGGCGNDCVPTSDVPRPGTCQLYTHWQNVYCGCLQNTCAWFTTK
jgi:hypothetical protein